MCLRMLVDSRAWRLPAAASASRRMARTLTSANSAATKNALAASSRITARIERYIDRYRREPDVGERRLRMVGQYRPDGIFGNVGTDEGLADPMCQHESQPRILHLLVPAHGCQQCVGWKFPVAGLGHPCRQAEPGQVR